MIEQIDELFTLLPEYGGYHIAVIDEWNLAQKFIDFANKHEVTLHLKNISKIQKDSTTFIKYENFSFEDKRYNLHSVIYDYIFVCVDLDMVMFEDILKKFYRVLKNAGYIYLFVKPDDIQRAKDALESINYLTPNEIDEFLGRKVISAQKMHGWKRV